MQSIDWVNEQLGSRNNLIIVFSENPDRNRKLLRYFVLLQVSMN